MSHKLLFLDAETFYDTDYSLSKLTPPEYILDPKFELIGCAAAEGSDPFEWIDGPDFSAYISQFDPENTTTVTFNQLFDGCVFAWRYGFIPKRMLCAMRMAAALRGHVLHSVALKSVAKCLGVGEKGTTIESVRGMRRNEIMGNPTLWRAFQAYALNDGELCRDIFFKLAPEFPSSERRIMDKVLRCAVVPRFCIDKVMLEQHLVDLEADKVRMLRLAAGGAEIDDNQDGQPLADEAQDMDGLEAFTQQLRSNPKFEVLLKARGVDIQYKVSPTGAQIPAFAKTDEFMEELQEHEDPVVQALATARMGVRSTIEQSRGARIMSISSLDWASTTATGNMPIPLTYSAAHTHRLGGTWKINMQNLPAGRGKNKSKLRKALVVPEGYEVVVADLSQIECRINAWICGQRDLFDIFAMKGDPYSVLASKIFGFKVDKAVHKTERFIGKSGVLGLGFGCGKDKFYNMVLRSARTLGMDMKALMKIWSPELAATSVDIYRSVNSDIVNAWRTLDTILNTAWIGASEPRQWGPVVIGEGYVALPNGMKMLYDVVKPVDVSDKRYRYGKKEHRMYGPKFLENIVQALARIVIMNASLRIADRGYEFALQSHDELAFIVLKADVARCMDIVTEELRRPPSWAKVLPLDCEVGHGLSYGDAK